ncbi:MAG: glycosyltransferase [Methylomicrobium sp.]|nr:glycosyltransferase [Methylomicrobium sp.]
MLHSLNEPTFSVIIASFNSAKTLRRAIDSILKQTYVRFEIIVIDDGSKDDTAKVVAQYDDNVHYFFQDNAGVSAARNHGVMKSSGNWLTFLDADDWYYPDRLQWHAEIISANSDVDFLIGDYHLGTEEGKVINRSMNDTSFGQQLLDAVDNNGTIFLDKAGLGSLIPSYFGHTTTFTLPRKTFMDLGGYSESFSIGEDLHLLIRLCARSNRVGVVCKPMAFYCIHDNGLMRSIGVQSQSKAVDTLLSLKQEMYKAAPPIKEGFLKVLLNHRYDWSVSLLKKGNYFGALKVFLPSLFECPSFKSFKMLLSLMKG